ncbi:MAG: hypothetical protein JWQ88_2971 [Rhodoferax sp.]|nr:hypothetical protein [Rhodoferax sp.]
MSVFMAQTNQIEQVTDRAERLLVRYDELKRTNRLLSEQVELLVHERDSLKSRLGAARARIDALLERLPEVSAPPVVRPAPRKDSTQ